MKKLAFLLGVSFLILLMGQVKGYTQDLYYYNASIAVSDFNMTGYANVTSSLGSCTTNLRIYADITGGAGKYLNFYLYENGTQLGSAVSYSSPQNATCLLLKNQTVSSGIVNATARVLNIGSPVSTNLYLEIHTDCGYAANSTISIFDEPALISDSIGRNMYNQRFTFNNTLPIDYANDTITTWNNLTPSHCGLTNKKIPALETIPIAGALISFVPFNSGVGLVNITGYGATNAFSGVRIGLLNPETDAVTLLYSASGGAAISIDSQLTLVPAADYIAWISNYQGAGGSGGFNPPVLNITLTDYEPNYSCTAWSVCSSGQQTKTCIDLGGLAPDTIQQRSCLLVNQTAVLGFENYYIPADRYICQPNLFPLCSLFGNILANVTVLFPDNPRWVIVPNSIYYYIGTINSETATLGSRSLKLWYIPQSPYSDQPFDNNGTAACGNTTVGTFPEIFRVINTSFMASLDFMFPAGTTELRFDVKRCDNNVVQYDGWCGKRCYAQNCTIPPSGDFIAALYDQVEAKNLFELTKEATANWTTYIAFLGNAVEDRNYTLRFSVLPLPINPTTTEGNCVYIDNVRLINTQISQIEIWCDEVYGQPCNELTDAEIQTVLLEKCVNECIGNDYYTRIIQDLTCIEEVSLNYSTCVTQYQQQQVGNQSIFIPISSIANTIVNTTTNQTLAESMTAGGYGFVLVFLTPIFWIFLIIIAVMSIVSLYTKHMEIGGVSGLLMLVAFAVYFPELVWITIIIIIIGAYLIGRQIVRVVQGG